MRFRWLTVLGLITATLSVLTVNAGGGLLAERFQLLKNSHVLVVVGRQAADSDYECAVMVREYLQNLEVDVEIVYDDLISEHELAQNIIVIGGPAANKVASTLNHKVSSWFEKTNE